MDKAAEQDKIFGENDKDRIKFMFLPFPANKTVNPKHWDCKLKFWTSEIIKSCESKGDICISCEKLNKIFRDGNGRNPAGLMTVLNELYSSGEILIMNDLDLLDKSWGQWGYKILSQSTSWFLKKIWYGSFNEQTVFVVKEILQNALKLLEAHYGSVKYEKTDNIVPLKVIKSLYKINNKNIPEDNLLYIIAYLKSKGYCTVGVVDGEQIVKFAKKSDNMKVEPLSILDSEIIKLKKAIAKLSIECGKLEKDTTRLEETARQHLRRKDKDKAKRTLAEKHKLEKTVKLKNDALFSMKEHLRTIQDAETTKMITDAFNSSSTLLQQTYRKQGLTVDHVEDVMEKAAEANDMVNELEEALSSGIKNLDDIDMDELEKELQELDVEQHEDVTGLPDVPCISPQKASQTLKNETPVLKDPLPAS